MAKVDWITWKTDIKEIINPDEIARAIKEKIDSYNLYLDSQVYKELNSEITSGGLEKASFDIMGMSPANENANKIIDNIESSKQVINKLYTKIVKNLEEQKEIEKKQLITAIEEKIQEEKKKLENTQTLQSKLTTDISYISSKEVNDVVDITNEKINVLMERLNMAKTL